MESSTQSTASCTKDSTSKKLKKISKSKIKKRKLCEYESSDDDEHSSDEDSSENEDDENFISKSRGAETNRTQTRGNSRPVRTAAMKAKKNLTTRKLGMDFHQQPELLYEQQVHRYSVMHAY